MPGRPAYGLLVLLLLGASGLPSPAAGETPPSLDGSCFSQTFDANAIAANPGRRVSAMSVTFQSFAGSLLASVTYRLRFGPKFAFSGDCAQPVDGRFLCNACATGSCTDRSENFAILWSGGDTVTLANERTGVVAENPEGGRDYLKAAGGNRLFVLKRGAPEACNW